MKIILSKAMSFFLLAILVLGTFPCSADAITMHEFPIYVGGVLVTYDNENDVLGDGTVSYNRVENVLKLKNADIKAAILEDGTYAIKAEKSIGIRLEGENIIEGIAHEERSFGIYVNGSLRLLGDSLSVKGGDVLSKNTVNKAVSEGIYCEEYLHIQGAKVEAHGGEIQGIIDDAETLGVYAGGNVEIKEGGSLNAFGGVIGGNVKKASSYGIKVVGEEKNLLSLDVYDGSLSAFGGEVTAWYTVESVGAYVEFGSVRTYNNDANVYLEGAEASLVVETNNNENNNYEGANYVRSNGAFVKGGNFTIDGGKVFFVSVNGDALFVCSANVKGTKKGGILEVYGYNIVPTSHGFGFTGTDVSFKSESGRAVACEVDTLIDVRLEITLPEGGGQYKDDDGYCVIKTMPLNETASEVTIGARVYEVLIEDAERSLSVIVPFKKSVNEIYAEKMGVKDFSEYLKTEKEGYTFEGWFSDEGFTQQFDFNAPIQEDLTVFGKWTASQGVESEGDTSEETSSTETSVQQSAQESSDTSKDENNSSNVGPIILIIITVVCLIVSIVLVVKKRTK